MARKAYPEAAEELQDSLAKDQFIDALEDREIRLKLRESGPKTLDEAVSRALQIEAMYEAESRRGKGRSVGQTCTRTTAREKERASRAYQAKHACYQPHGCGGSTATAISLEGSKCNKTNAGRARDLRLRLCFKCHKKGHFMAECKQAFTGSGNRS